MTRFSVIVPAHDRASTIERTVRSVLLAADVAPGITVDLVVVDDGSTDATADVVRSLAAEDARLTLVEQPNSGVAAARNAGMRHSRGDLLAFVDADDEVDPRWLALLASQLAGHDIVFCEGRAVRAGRPDEARVPKPLGPAFADVTGVFLPGLFAVRRDVLDEAGGYAIPLRYSENTELGLRICRVLAARREVRAGVVREPLVTIHLPPERRSHAYSHQNRLESALYLVRTHADRFALDPPLHGTYWAIAGVAAARLGRGRTAMTCFVRAARAEPANRRHVARAVAALVPPLRRRLWPAVVPGL